MGKLHYEGKTTFLEQLSLKEELELLQLLKQVDRQIQKGGCHDFNNKTTAGDDGGGAVPVTQKEALV